MAPARRAAAKKRGAGRTPAPLRSPEFPSLQLSSSSSDSEADDLSPTTRQNTLANSGSGHLLSPKPESNRRSASKTPDPDLQRDLVDATPMRNDSMEARLSPVLRRASAAQAKEMDVEEPEQVAGPSRARSPAKKAAKSRAAAKSGKVPLGSPPPKRALRPRPTPSPITSTPRSNSKSPKPVVIPTTIPEEAENDSSRSSSSSETQPPVPSTSRASPKPPAKKGRPPAQPRMSVPSRAALRRQAHAEQAGTSKDLPKSPAKKSKAAAEPSGRPRAASPDSSSSASESSPPKRRRKARASPKPGPSHAKSQRPVVQPPVAATASPKPPAKKPFMHARMSAAPSRADRAVRPRPTPSPITSTRRPNSKSPRAVVIPSTIPEETESNSSKSSSSSSSESQPPVPSTSRASPKPPAKKGKAPPQPRTSDPSRAALRRSSSASRSSGSHSSEPQPEEDQAPSDANAAPKPRPKPPAKRPKLSQKARMDPARTGSDYQLHLPVSRVRRQMKQELPKKRMAKNSSIAVAAAVQTILTEVIAGAMDVAKSQGTTRINPRHIMMAIKADEELDHIFKDVTIAGAGYVPLHPTF
ncbi:unnamed protein product [Bursaphelenchus xylophilus]|uniref:(pine wood nematode) hypothetical protein n=1 Tax=Bursaphelenchus xylophilus TaxID=6326 RepID=A0A1I7RVN5_BURXY|nr:unnamed protein product [Bursaphelenchus xylophilus]CAG9081929.1 unnamed protein product [Bursaphelenchus xylophilus]